MGFFKGNWSFVKLDKSSLKNPFDHGNSVYELVLDWVPGTFWRLLGFQSTEHRFAYFRNYALGRWFDLTEGKEIFRQKELDRLHAYLVIGSMKLQESHDPQFTLKGAKNST